MKEVRQFHTGELFGIKAYTNDVRTGVKVACLGAYVPANHGFRVNMISSEGVMGSQQCMRFEHREDAERFIRERGHDLDYDDLAIIVNRGDSECQKVPVANFDVPAWVNVRKWDYTSPANLEIYKREMPDFFEEEVSTILETPILNIPNARYLDSQTLRDNASRDHLEFSKVGDNRYKFRGTKQNLEQFLHEINYRLACNDNEEIDIQAILDTQASRRYPYEGRGFRF